MSFVGLLAIGLMVIVLIIAAASLVIVATIPLGSWLQKRRDARTNSDPSAFE